MLIYNLRFVSYNNKMKILLIGPQGSGKSTQAELLAKNLSLPKITVGDIFRQIASEDTPEGKRIKDILDKGHLVDDQTTSEIVKARLQEADSQQGFILDGYPRTVEQLQIFDPGFDQVIYVNVPEDEVINRMTERGRADDTEDLINKRLDLYYQQTQPLLDYYKNLGILIEIDGRGSVEDIQQKIRGSFIK